ncbi:xylose isomerase [Mycobacterium intracellulare]|uniref:sugar phosphate isomerase/epimerase family protein n=1 Tax=Mycobacterium intracellulare TaxID=1767 RepID=UPI0007E9F5F1|nr:TIM barrel protein [Mycobacterium intracellulare]OBH73959.1 xylose isomerase [Mycobacterium intracellulare]
MDRLGIEFLSIFGMPPLEFISLTAELGCHYISTALYGVPLPELGYPTYSLKDDKRLRRDVVAALADTGVKISLGEGLLILPERDCAVVAADLDVMAELGAEKVNVVSFEPDLRRSCDEFAAITEMASQRGLGTVTEVVPGFTVGDLNTGMTVVEYVDRPEFRLLIDTMHIARLGARPADLAALPRNSIGYIQLSDTTMVSRFDDYNFEAMNERLVPGTGEVPLKEYLAELPKDVVVGLEMPQREAALAGAGAAARLRPGVEAARELLASI